MLENCEYQCEPHVKGSDLSCSADDEEYEVCILNLQTGWFQPKRSPKIDLGMVKLAHYQADNPRF